MASMSKKNFDSPDETLTPEKVKVDNVDLGNGVSAARMEAQPGWKWSDCIKPIVGTDSCEKPHVGVCVSGKIKVIHDDGSELEIGPGDAYTISPGHDAWVLGDEPYVAYEFNSETASTYAKS